MCLGQIHNSPLKDVGIEDSDGMKCFGRRLIRKQRRHLDRSELTSWVQKRDAACHACGGLGEVTAHFKLNGTRAEATQILFRSDPE
jgi:hypothetical protein